MIVEEARGTQGAGSRMAAAVPHGEGTAVLPHLDVGYRLVRWLVGRQGDADEIVLESVRIAVFRAGTMVGGASRAWFLRIVSDVCANRSRGARTVEGPRDPIGRDARGSRSGAVGHHSEPSTLEDAIWSLPVHLREVVVLRELEGLSTEELAEVMGVPAATVASRLSRARLALAGVLFARPLTV